MKYLVRRLSPSAWIPLGALFIYLTQGFFAGMTDDEAYYWVLSQHPQWGYAFHPPAAPLLIALSNWLLGGLLPHVWVPRLPAAACAAGAIYFAIRWFEALGLDRKSVLRASLLFLAVPGIFGPAWMMVPDLPLVLGWSMAFFFSWKLLQGSEKKADLLGLAAGVTLAIVSKYSAVLILISIAIGSFLSPLSKQKKLRILIVALASGGLAMIPSVIWNLENGWEPLLYQIRERHSGSELSWVRYLQFWLLQILLVGPALVTGSFWLALRELRERKRSTDVCLRYAWIWAFPAAVVFWPQPLWAEFKPHWVLIVWLPLILDLAQRLGRLQFSALRKAQLVYGFPLMVVLMISCHVPLLTFAIEKITGKPADPRWDVTNDLYGWRRFEEFAMKFEEFRTEQRPLLASRYQTAAQAAFALDRPYRVSRVPRSSKEFAEWPQLGATVNEGPEWPKLIKPILFVSDNRYTEEPRYPESSCRTLGTLEDYRAHRLAKWIKLYRCDPLKD